jgi:hypothetical protein
VSLHANQNRRISTRRGALRIIEIAIVLVVAGLALTWIGPLAWMILDRAWLYAY